MKASARRFAFAFGGAVLVMGLIWLSPAPVATAPASTQGQPPAAQALPEGWADLPLIEAPAPLGSPDTRPDIVLFWSADSGWTGLSQALAEALNARGLPVVGVDSSRYFSEARTPEAIAADIEKISRHYFKQWQKSRLILIGDGQGADVLPFAVNRLSPEIRRRVSVIAAMGLSGRAVFGPRDSEGVGKASAGLPTLTEIARIKHPPLLCIYGEGDADSVCPNLSGDSTTAVKLPGHHPFDGDAAKLSAVILGALPK